VDIGIRVDGLRKRYGTAVAVDDLSFVVKSGQVTGFVGPNGAGKTTTFRLILALARAEAGRALVNGRPYASMRRPLRELGALIDAGATHPGRRARDHLRWIAETNDLPRTRIDEVLELVGLTSVARRRTGGFSLGMAQRLGIAAALLGDPPALMLDEPVNGLDPEGIRWMRGLLRSLAAEGRAVFVSSHLMAELEDTADHLIVVGRGRLLADTTVADLRNRASDHSVALRTPDRADAMAALARAGATVTSSDADDLTVHGLAAEQVAALMAELRLRVHALVPHHASLEEAYVRLTHDAVDYAGSTRPVERGSS